MLSILITVFHFFFFSQKNPLPWAKYTVTFFSLLFAKHWILSSSKSCHLMVFNTVQPLSATDSIDPLPSNMFLLFYCLILFSLLFSSPTPVLLFGFLLPSPLHCSMDVSWLSPWLCYFGLLTMLSAFGESPRTSLPSVWGECSSYLNEYFRFKDFYFFLTDLL